MTQRPPDDRSNGVGSLRRHGGGTGSPPASRLAALAIGGNIRVYSTLDAKEAAVQAVVDVPAGSQITADMLRTVDVDVDSSVNVIAGSDLPAVVGQYAKVRIVSGSLLTSQSLQADTTRRSWATRSWPSR